MCVTVKFGHDVVINFKPVVNLIRRRCCCRRHMAVVTPGTDGVVGNVLLKWFTIMRRAALPFAEQFAPIYLED